MKENETESEFMAMMEQIISSEKSVIYHLEVMNKCGVSRKTIDKFLVYEVNGIFGDNPEKKERKRDGKR